MKKRINLRLILIAGIAVIVTMVCMTGIYYKLFQGQVRKDLPVSYTHLTLPTTPYV